MEELENLDLTCFNQNPINEDNQKNDQLQDDVFEVDKEISIKDDEIKEKEIKNGAKKVVKSVDIANIESFEIKSYEVVDKGNHQNKSINSVGELKNPPKVEALIPLPPKPKYSYLNKWLLRS